MVSTPLASPPVLLMVWLMMPLPPSDTVAMLCMRTPERLGTSKPLWVTIEGSTLLYEYAPRPQASCVVTWSPTLYEAQPRVLPFIHAAWFGGS